MNSNWVGLLGLFAVVAGVAYFFYAEWKRSAEAGALKAARIAISYPLQLQAAERMILFLERIKPKRLLPRISSGNPSFTELQQAILQEIRAELDHNAAQQLYMRKDTWEKISAAATATSAALVHAVAERAGIGDSKAIIVSILQNEDEAVYTLIEEAIAAIKDEVQQNF